MSFNKENKMTMVSEYWDEGLECMSLDSLQKRRLLKMQKHVRYVYQNSAFYKTAFDEAGVRPEDIKTLDDFRERVPLLAHEQLVENQRNNPPYGDFMTTGIKDVRRIYCSPGPLIMPFSKSDMEVYINTTANGIYIAGARRGDIVDITYGYHWDLAGSMLDDGFRRIGCAVVPGGTGMTKMHVRIMRQLGVTVIFAAPSFAMKIADTAEAMGLDPKKDLKVHLIIIGGEVYDDSEKEELSERFGAEVRRMYGGAEVGFVGAECSHGGGLHSYSESIIETIDPETGQIITDGGPGEMVCTDLTRIGMPILRYRTGDLIDGVNAEPCPCGRTSLRVGRVVGRVGKILRVKGVYLIPEQIKEVIAMYKEMGAFQVFLERDRTREKLLIRVESKVPEDDESTKASLIEDLRAVTRLRAEIELVPFNSIGKDAPMVIDKRF
jgi:phenylacetate-CoA ligase